MTGRRQHYAHFYGLLPIPRGDRPLLIVHGNCRAESLRVLLDGSASPVGTAEVRSRAGRGPRPVIVSILRWAALHPFQVIVRSPAAQLRCYADHPGIAEAGLARHAEAAAALAA